MNNGGQRIVACLAWYDEPAGHLDRCVRSLDGVADHLIAVDGAWHHYPDGQSSSAPEQADEIEAAAQAIGLCATVYAGRQWDSQVEKRAWLMQTAARCGDWLLVIDGDEEIYSAGTSLHSCLSDTERDVATILCRSVSWHDGTSSSGQIRRIYRASAGITVEHAHNGYRTADRRWLHGDPSNVTLEPAIAAPITLRHYACSRGEQRNQAALGYRHARRAARAEQWPSAHPA